MLRTLFLHSLEWPPVEYILQTYCSCHQMVSTADHGASGFRLGAWGGVGVYSPSTGVWVCNEPW